MFISNTYVTDNSTQARIFQFKKRSCSPQLMFMLSFFFWPEAPPSTYLPITKSVLFRHPGCQLGSNYRSSRYVPKPKRPRYESELRGDKVRNKTRICIGDAFDRWRRLKAEKNLKTDANVADFLLNR